MFSHYYGDRICGSLELLLLLLLLLTHLFYVLIGFGLNLVVRSFLEFIIYLLPWAKEEERIQNIAMMERMYLLFIKRYYNILIYFINVVQILTI